MLCCHLATSTLYCWPQNIMEVKHPYMLNLYCQTSKMSAHDSIKLLLQQQKHVRNLIHQSAREKMLQKSWKSWLLTWDQA